MSLENEPDQYREEPYSSVDYDAYQRELSLCNMTAEINETAFKFQNERPLTPGQSYLAASITFGGGTCACIGPGEMIAFPYGDTAHSPEDELEDTEVICDAGNFKDDLRELEPEPLFLNLPERLESAVEIQGSTGIVFERNFVLAGFYLNGDRVMHDMNTGKHQVLPADRAFLDDENYRLELKAMEY